MRYLTICLLLSVIIFSCKKNNSEDNPSITPPVVSTDSVLNPNLHIIDSTILLLVSDTSLLDQGHLEYSIKGNVPNFKINDVIVGSTNGGYIRKIVAVSQTTGKIVIESTQGTMEDVFNNASFKYSVNMDSLKQSRVASGYQFDISNTTIYKDGPLSITLDKALISIDGNWNFGFSFKHFKLDSFEISNKNLLFNSQLNLTVSASQAVQLPKRTLTLGRISKSNIFFVDLVPVLIYTEVELRCTVSAIIEAKVERKLSIGTTNNADVSSKYKDGQWSNVFTNKGQSNINVGDREGNIKFDVGLSLIPYVSFRLYRLVGPYASIGLEETIKGSVASPALDWNFYAGAWLHTTVGVKAGTLGKSLFDEHKDWYSDTISYQTPYRIERTSGDNQTGYPGEYLSNPLKVKVLDNLDHGESNVPVNFKVTTGGGSVETETILTDKDGYAQTRFKLASSIGIQTVEASVKNGDKSFILNAPLDFAAATKVPQNPIVNTTAVSNVTSSSAISGGSITSDGGSPIIAKGVTWSTSPAPTIVLTTKTNDGSGNGSFISSISGLKTNTKYYLRAYATNSTGTSYGNEVIFSAGNLGLPPTLTGLTYSLVTWRYGASIPGLMNSAAVNDAPLYVYIGKYIAIFDTDKTFSHTVYDSSGKVSQHSSGNSYTIGSYSPDSLFIPQGGGPSNTYAHQYPEGWGFKLPPGYSLNLAGYICRLSADGSFFYEVGDLVYARQ